MRELRDFITTAIWFSRNVTSWICTQTLVARWTNAYIYEVCSRTWCTCFGSTYTKIGTIQRRLAWPLRKDDTQNREAFHIFCPGPCLLVNHWFRHLCCLLSQICTVLLPQRQQRGEGSKYSSWGVHLPRTWVRQKEILLAKNSTATITRFKLHCKPFAHLCNEHLFSFFNCPQVLAKN